MGTLDVPGNTSCTQGLVSPLYVEVTGAADVQKIFDHARTSGTTLSIKNSGHDYVMRSSRRGSLAIWTRGIQGKTFHTTFVPKDCVGIPETTAITFGAGVNTDEAVTFAHENGFVFDGGSGSTIGVSGGWVLNGGHSVLSNNIGLGVDRILQFTIVTADGQVRIANQCQNPELFWALRGGGSGSFGVVLNSTFRVEREAPITAALIDFKAEPDEQRRFVEILAANMRDWALQGWGGPLAANQAILVNPRSEVNVSTAEKTLAPLIAHAKTQKGKVTVLSFPSYFEFYQEVVNGTHAIPVPVSVSVITTSRVIPETVFTNDSMRATMVDTIMDLQNSGIMVSMLSTMPLLYSRTQTQENRTAMHPAWYRSVWSIVGYTMMTAKTPLKDRLSMVSMLQQGTDSLTKLAPGGSTYPSEGYAWMKNWSQELWGENYPALLALKRRYDPHQLLSCWHCVGWDESQPDYECISNLAPSIS
jgi:FAD/FMN-containing dehydrogenase